MVPAVRVVQTEALYSMYYLRVSPVFVEKLSLTWSYHGPRVTKRPVSTAKAVSPNNPESCRADPTALKIPVTLFPELGLAGYLLPCRCLNLNRFRLEDVTVINNTRYTFFPFKNNFRREEDSVLGPSTNYS